MRYPFVSIVVPVLNEEKNLAILFKSLKALEYPKEKLEVIIVDGGSTEGTVELARKSGAKVIFNSHKLRGPGCQIGVESAKGEIIAFTDADCAVPKDWLTLLLKQIQGKVISAGGPNITPNDDTPFAKACGEVIGLLTKAGARYGYAGGEAREVFHNSGCNAIYKKSAIIEAGGFNYNLITCEDEELDFRLRKKSYKLFYESRAVVLHYRRPTYKKIFKQAYRYAIGRAQAIRLHRDMAKWFHFVPSLILIMGITGVGFGIFRILGVFEVVGGLSIASFLSYKHKHQPFYVYLLILLLWITGWGVGFIRGIFYHEKGGTKEIKNTWADYWKNYHGVTKIGAWSQRQALEKVFTVLFKEKIGKGIRIIDVGCGEGRTLLALRDKEYKNTLGIDNTTESLLICGKKGLRKGRDVFLEEAENTKYKNGEFGLVFSEGLLEHFTDPKLLILEMGRISSQYILLIQPNHYSLYGKIIAFWGHLLRGNVREYSFPKSYFIKEFARVGFSLKREEETNLGEFWILLFEKS